MKTNEMSLIPEKMSLKYRVSMALLVWIGWLMYNEQRRRGLIGSNWHIVEVNPLLILASFLFITIIGGIIYNQIK